MSRVQKIIAKKSQQVGAYHYTLAISTPGHNPPPAQAPKIQTSLTYKDSQND